jgi:pyruvate/2-oxoglutarate/acetoin dehydrogenase E1 component
MPLESVPAMIRKAQARRLRDRFSCACAARLVDAGGVVIVEQGQKSGGVGAEIAASLRERLPGLRVARVASADVPVPFSPPLENAYRPDVARVVAAARSLCVTGRS